MNTEMVITLNIVDIDVILDMDRGLSDAAQSELSDMFRVVNDMPRNVPITIWGADYEEMMTIVRRGNGMWELVCVGGYNLPFRTPQSEMFNPDVIVEWVQVDPAHHEDY